MKITALVENQSQCDFVPVHGLSLYIETPKHNILFDLGPDKTLFKNSKTGGIDLSKVDTVIISHGHMDHGGALEDFLKINSTAKIYVQRKAFEPHFAKVSLLKLNVGLNPDLATHPQVQLVDGNMEIDDELMLFTVENREKCYSPANDTLYAENGKDDFSHEQNLVIFGENNLLVMGCGHTGIVNIMEAAGKYKPKVCIGGYHLFNPTTKKTVEQNILENIAQELSKYNTEFYTCHCTGEKAFQYLASRMPNMHYISCGQTIEV